MGNGRWGGRPPPHIGGRDASVGGPKQGETIPANFKSTPARGSLNQELDGEGLPGFSKREGGSLNKEVKGEKRDSGNSKVLGGPAKPANFTPSKGDVFVGDKSGLTTDPPTSQAQRAAMHAAAEGNSTLGIPKSVGKEFSDADPGGKLPAHHSKK